MFIIAFAFSNIYLAVYSHKMRIYLKYVSILLIKLGKCPNFVQSSLFAHSALIIANDAVAAAAAAAAAIAITK